MFICHLICSAILLDRLGVARDLSGRPAARLAFAAAEAHWTHAHREPERAAARPHGRTRRQLTNQRSRAPT